MIEMRITCDKAAKWYWILEREGKKVAIGRSYQGKKLAMRDAMELIKTFNEAGKQPELIHLKVDNLEVMVGGHTQ